jgi:hypothetical protein
LREKDLDQEGKELYRQIMLNCQAERKQKTNTTIRELAKRLGKTENFISSLENGRVYCSFKLFLSYLKVNSLRHGATDSFGNLRFGGRE